MRSMIRLFGPHGHWYLLCHYASSRNLKWQHIFGLERTMRVLWLKNPWLNELSTETGAAFMVLWYLDKCAQAQLSLTAMEDSGFAQETLKGRRNLINDLVLWFFSRQRMERKERFQTIEEFRVRQWETRHQYYQQLVQLADECLPGGYKVPFSGETAERLEEFYENFKSRKPPIPAEEILAFYPSRQAYLEAKMLDAKAA